MRMAVWPICPVLEGLYRPCRPHSPLSPQCSSPEIADRDSPFHGSPALIRTFPRSGYVCAGCAALTLAFSGVMRCVITWLGDWCGEKRRPDRYVHVGPNNRPGPCPKSSGTGRVWSVRDGLSILAIWFGFS